MNLPSSSPDVFLLSKIGPKLSALALFSLLFLTPPLVRAQGAQDIGCPRFLEGALVQEPPEIASKDGLLKLSLNFRSVVGEDGKRRYCFVSETGKESPTLRLSPGDHLSIHLQNDLPVAMSADAMPGMQMSHVSTSARCGGAMSDSSTNLHFHGLSLPPVCHQDDSIHALVGAGENFDYELQIPWSNPPGLYWYHPHPHGISQGQVQGGASGAIIVRGIKSAVPALASLPERTFVLRDQLLSHTVNAPDALTPSWDISLNYVPIKYPQYVPATIQVEPGERQLWRIVNAAANTIFDLQVIYGGVPQQVQVYAVDGVPLSTPPAAQTSIYLPPGSRVEFVVRAPSLHETAQLVTQKVDSGTTGDSAPARPIANIIPLHETATRVQAVDAPDMVAIKGSAKTLHTSSLSELKPARIRNLYFSQNGNGTEGGAGAATKFWITVLGQRIQSYDMTAPPNIVVQQGTVEDWIIQNTTPEDHIFHIHQVHFQLVAVNGMPVDDPTIRDTIRVPHQVGRTPLSSIRLRMDFRDPNVVGNFVYHCHILDHEDRGMMGAVQVLPAVPSNVVLTAPSTR